jgi:hypothetical protein
MTFNVQKSMTQKILKLFFIVSLISITGCSNETTEIRELQANNSDDLTVENTDQNLERQEVTKEKAEWQEDGNISAAKVGESQDTPIGKMTLINTTQIGETFSTGPFNVEIGAISIAKVFPNQSSKTMFNNKDEATLLSISMQVNNTSPETLSFHPNQGTIVVGSEQQKADLFMSEDVGGDFIGEVKKTGKEIFILETPPEEIKSVKYVIDPPFSLDKFETPGDKLTLEFTIK